MQTLPKSPLSHYFSKPNGNQTRCLCCGILLTLKVAKDTLECGHIWLRHPENVVRAIESQIRPQRALGVLTPDLSAVSLLLRHSGRMTKPRLNRAVHAPTTAISQLLSSFYFK